MSPVANAPMNLTDTLVSRPRTPSCASYAASGFTSRFYGGSPDWWDTWKSHRPHSYGERYLLAVPVEALSARWLEPSVDGIFHALSLPGGWDSYDARPIAHSTAQNALTFLARFFDHETVPPVVVPLADGGVQLEWHRGGLDVEIMFSPDDQTEVYVANHETGEEWSIEATSAALASVRPLLARLRAE